MPVDLPLPSGAGRVAEHAEVFSGGGGTLLPFGITALVLTAVGYGFQSYAPEAGSPGEVLQHYRAPKQ